MAFATTVYVACPNGWTKLADLYGTTVPNVSGWTVSCRAQSIQWAIAQTTPTATYGHPMSAADSVFFGDTDIDKVWFKNEVSATIGYLVITPTTAF